MKYLKSAICFWMVVLSIALSLLPGKSFSQDQRTSDTLLRHVVLIEFNDELSDAMLHTLESDVQELKQSISQIYDLEWGENTYPDSEYTYCLVVTFRNEEDLSQYRVHPDHMNFAAKYGPYVSKITEMGYWLK
jgi:hypothetical protein